MADSLAKPARSWCRRQQDDPATEKVWVRMLLRHAIGDVLRRMRQQQGRTLREVAESARVSVPYLSEVERGRKEASSEILAAVCLALGVSMRTLLDQAGAVLAYESLPIEQPLPVAQDVRSPTRPHSPDDVLAMVGPGPWVEPDLPRFLTTC
jgi:transcriptional regulator with XRE-family HTH domain